MHGEGDDDENEYSDVGVDTCFASVLRLDENE